MKQTCVSKAEGLGQSSGLGALGQTPCVDGTYLFETMPCFASTPGVSAPTQIPSAVRSRHVGPGRWRSCHETDRQRPGITAIRTKHAIGSRVPAGPECGCMAHRYRPVSQLIPHDFPSSLSIGTEPKTISNIVPALTAVSPVVWSEISNARRHQLGLYQEEHQ